MKEFITKTATALGVLTIMSILFVIPVSAQDTSPTPTPDQSTSIAQQNLTGSTPNTSVILSPDQQSLNSLSTPGLLPDSPFYFLKRWGENIQTFFTIDDYQRAQLQLHFAQQRLAEAQAELQKNNANLTDQMLNDYNKDIRLVSLTTQKLAEEGKEVSHLVDTIKDREQTRLALLQSELVKTTNPIVRQRLQNAINFTTNQSQTNINRLVHAITHTPSYKPSAYETVSGQVTAVNAPNFNILTASNKTLTFTTDTTTVFKQYSGSSSTSFTALTVGVYVHVTFPRSIANVSGAPAPALAKTVIFGVPKSLIVPLVGTIANFAPNSFTLNASTGQAYTIQVNMSTVYHTNRDDATGGDIHDGTHVRIYAVPQTNSNTFLAKIIYVELPKKLSRTGIITAIQGTVVTVAAKNNGTYTFNLTGNTLVQKNGQPASSTDLTVSEIVTVWYYGNESVTTANATDINIHAYRVPRTNAASPTPKTIPTISPTPTKIPSPTTQQP